MSIDIDTIEPRRCPICDAGVLSKLDSPTGLSHFIKFACGFEMCDQYEARPRGWKPRFGSTCRNIDANSLWALRRAVEQSAEDFNAEAVARLKAESDVRELRAALERARALVAELEWCGVDAWLACPWCLGYQDAHPGERHGHAADCKLAAFLAAGSGGAV